MIMFTIIGMFVTGMLFLVVLAVLYWEFVHPIFQAISLTRWNIACGKKMGIDFTDYPYLKVFSNYYTIGGHPGVRTWNTYGEWLGIGRWLVFDSEEDEAP